MTDPQRQQLHDLLMDGVGLGNPAYSVLDDIVTRDLDAIEPVIDGMVADAFEAGKKLREKAQAA